MSTIIAAMFNLFITLGSSLPGRVLSALGIGWLTYAGLSAAVASLVSLTLTNWNAIPATIYQIASLSGFTDAVGITTAAITARVAVAAMPRLGKLS